LSFKRLRLRVEIFSIRSRVSSTPLGQQALVGLFVVQVGLENLAAQQIAEALQALVGEDCGFRPQGSVRA